MYLLVALIGLLLLLGIEYGLCYLVALLTIWLVPTIVISVAKLAGLIMLVMFILKVVIRGAVKK